VRRISRGGSPNGGSLFLFFDGFVSGFFGVVNVWVFGEKGVFVRGVLWIADGKMCGKRGLRDALFFGLDRGRFGCRGWWSRCGREDGLGQESGSRFARMSHLCDEAIMDGAPGTLLGSLKVFDNSRQ
jgi:hypothetical protein